MKRFEILINNIDIDLYETSYGRLELKALDNNLHRLAKNIDNNDFSECCFFVTYSRDLNGELSVFEDVEYVDNDGNDNYISKLTKKEINNIENHLLMEFCFQ